MTLITTGLVSLLAGIAVVVRSRSERRAIQAALTGRLRAGIALVLGGALLVAVGARIQGQILFRRWKRTHRAEIDFAQERFDRLRPVVESLGEEARRR